MGDDLGCGDAGGAEHLVASHDRGGPRRRHHLHVHRHGRAGVVEPLGADHRPPARPVRHDGERRDRHRSHQPRHAGGVGRGGQPRELGVERVPPHPDLERGAAVVGANRDGSGRCAVEGRAGEDQLGRLPTVAPGHRCPILHHHLAPRSVRDLRGVERDQPAAGGREHAADHVVCVVADEVDGCGKQGIVEHEHVASIDVADESPMRAG